MFNRLHSYETEFLAVTEEKPQLYLSRFPPSPPLKPMQCACGRPQTIKQTQNRSSSQSPPPPITKQQHSLPEVIELPPVPKSPPARQRSASCSSAIYHNEKQDSRLDLLRSLRVVFA